MRWCALWLVGLIALGCDDGDGGSQQRGTDDMGLGGAGGESGAGGEGGAGGAGGGAPEVLPQAGAWFFNVRLVEVGGLEVPFQLELELGEARVSRFALRAVGAARSVSAPILVAEDLAVVDGAFEVPRTAFVMPAAFSPTGSDVQLELGMTLQIRAPDDLCGTVIGSVITIGTELEASTFAAVPWGTEPAAPLASCADVPAPPLPRRDSCPSLVEGPNTGFESAGLMREFLVFLPEGHDPQVPTPTIFLFHGLTASAEAMVESSAMDTFVDDLGFILIAPRSHEDGAIEWDSSSAGDNPDLAFFDDLSACAIESLGADPARLYTTGLSAGSMEASYLGLYRSEVVAATASLSTGLLAPVRQDAPPQPFLTAWGGAEDLAFDQNFEVLTQALNTELRALGHPVVTCNHGQEHYWRAEFTPWVLEFLLAHALGDALAFEALPDTFPDYCSILP